MADTVGSNMFLLTPVLGVVWTCQGHMPLAEMGDWIWVNIDIVLVSSVVSSVIIRLKPPKRWMGTVMFVAYVLYIVAIFLL